MPADTSGVHVLVSGHVQGVGFRYFVKQVADAHGTAGWVRNLRDGRVEALLAGTAVAVHAVLAELGRGPAGSRVDEVLTRVALDGESAAARRPLEIRETS